MDNETMRASFNAFLKMYFDSCREVYEELNIKDINGRQFKYLREIDRRGTMTMSELAEAFHLSKPSITEMIRKFEDTGMLVRKRCSEDGRVYNIVLTDHGKLLAKTNVLESDKAIKKIFERLTQNELATLKKLFDKIGQVTS